MAKYKVKWSDVTEYETEIEAASKEEALQKFNDGEVDSFEPTGTYLGCIKVWVQQEEDSVEIEEISPDSD